MGKLHLSVRLPGDPLERGLLIYTRWVDLAMLSDSWGIFSFLISFPLFLKRFGGRMGILLAFCSVHVSVTKN